MMALATVAGFFKGKSILVTGSTGFLGKLLVERILHVQPDVKKLYLLVRAPDVASAKKRVQTEQKCVIGNDLFNVLREQHGSNFNSFIEEKISPLAGDIISENLGCEGSEIDGLAEELDIIVNGAATTRFCERYDVALASNALGVLHLLQFAKQCTHIKMFLHVSTAYVGGVQESLLMEKPFKTSETLQEGAYLDIDAEIQLVDNLKFDLKMQASDTSSVSEKEAMKDLGMKRLESTRNKIQTRHFGWSNVYVFTKAMGEMLLGHMRGELPVVIIRPSIVTSTIEDPMPGWIEGIRTIDVIIVGHADQTIPCFISDCNTIVDVIPADMVINAIIVAMAAHWNDKSQVIYHVTSSLENPLSIDTIVESMYRCFSMNPYIIKQMGIKRERRLLLIHRYAYFIAYTFLVYKLPLEMFHVVNLLFCGLFSHQYNTLNRNYNRLMHLAKLYAPFAFFKGRFDITNATRLRTTAGTDFVDAYKYSFDPKSVNWASYFCNVHIPALIKIAREKKSGNACDPK
ncbi:hypothetical protein ACP4OV_029134 [Aristida adscensionis]